MHARIVFVLTCVFTIIAGISVVFGEPEEPPKVTLPHGGVLVGSFMKTFNGRTVRAFRGIPYAKPPIGELRFKPSVPIDSWSGERLANNNGAMCPQGHHDEPASKWTGDENCLYLNVYAPESRTSDGPLSVMVYFHGGCWIIGEGGSNWYGPDHILEHDVVLVVGNYRLGPLGFLSTGTNHCPGNYGLKDQLLVMKWIQENIERFEGNPHDVTLFGESAGGASIAYHMYSAASKGLFHKAILQSGTLFDSWASVDKNVTLARTKKLGTILGCGGEDENWPEMLKCLREKPAMEVAHAVVDFLEFESDPITVFTPVVEPESNESIYSKHPRDIASPPSGSIPIMIGITSDEGAIRSARMVKYPDEVKPRFDELLPLILLYKHKPKDVQQNITTALKDFYFNGKVDWTSDNYQNLTDIFTDGWCYAGMDRFLRARFELGEKENLGATFVYQFDQRGPISAIQIIYGYPEFYGVAHLEELLYLFPFTVDPSIIRNGSDKNDIAIRKIMPQLWTNFARTGNPTPPGSDIVHWKPATKFPLEFAHIGGKNSKNWSPLRNEIGLAEDRIQFWRTLEKILENY